MVRLRGLEPPRGHPHSAHSPCFVDFSRDHTSIVRVERDARGQISGTTIFRPAKADFDDNDRECLKLLNLCDPYVAEFFFGGKAVIVEGDTEYTAFMHVIASDPQKYQDVHVVRARGKATIVSLCKILNQFGAPYSVLHDSDRPTCISKGKKRKNPAWAHNESILREMGNAFSPTRRLASVPNFEEAYLGEEAKNDKPYNLLQNLQAKPEVFEKLVPLLDSLIDFTNAVPQGATEWDDIESLNKVLADFEQRSPQPDPPSA